MDYGEYQEQPKTLWDTLATVGVFLAALSLLWLWSYPVLHPLVWDEVASAAGLRPPDQPFPGVYRGILALLFRTLPAAHVLDALPWLGHVAIAAAAAGVYRIFRDILPSALRLKAHVGRIGGRLGRLVALEAALVFLCADPIWRSGQVFAPTTVFICLTVLTMQLFFAFVRKGKIAPLYFCFAVLGVLSGETPLGFLLALIVVLGVVLAANWASSAAVPLVNPFVDGLVREVVFKRLSYTWAFCFASTIALNVGLFMLMGGMEASGAQGDVLGILLLCLQNCISSFKTSLAPAAWLFAPLLGVVPFVLSVRLLPRAWDDDNFLPFLVGVLYAAVGVVAVSQLSGARVLWFWTWLRSGSIVPSDTVLSFVLMFDVAAAAFAVAVFGVDACCRNYRRIAQQKYPESMQYKESVQLAESLGKARTIRRRIFFAVLVAVPLCVLPGRVQTMERGMLQVMADYVEEVVKETKACDTMFTDGSYDALVELAALREGHALRCLSLISPHTPRMRAIRMRAQEGEEDAALLEHDASSALRTWVSSANPRMKRTAVQVGFECWRKNKLDLPPLSGVVALPGGCASNELARALQASRKLADRICALSGAHDLPSCTDTELRRNYPFAGFRIARLAQVRSWVADQAGRKDVAFREAALADELDNVNYELQAMRERLNWINKQRVGVLTPREGLVIGLSRADFTLAAQYANPILRDDPDEPRANFAVAMKFYQDEQWSRAETHLLRCLVRRPNEPAVLNNLALVQMHMGKLDEAETHARRTVELYPQLAEAKRTLERVQKAKSERNSENEKKQE